MSSKIREKVTKKCPSARTKATGTRHARRLGTTDQYMDDLPSSGELRKQKKIHAPRDGIQLFPRGGFREVSSAEYNARRESQDNSRIEATREKVNVPSVPMYEGESRANMPSSFKTPQPPQSTPVLAGAGPFVPPSFSTIKVIIRKMTDMKSL